MSAFRQKFRVDFYQTAVALPTRTNHDLIKTKICVTFFIIRLFKTKQYYVVADKLSPKIAHSRSRIKIVMEKKKRKESPLTLSFLLQKLIVAEHTILLKFLLYSPPLPPPGACSTRADTRVHTSSSSPGLDGLKYGGEKKKPDRPTLSVSSYRRPAAAVKHSAIFTVFFFF